MIESGGNGQEHALSMEGLQRPHTFPHPVTRLELHATHVSLIILTGPYAYKIKKAVRLGFIDTRTLERRRELCELELRLNRRLAPDLYLDVIAVVRSASGQTRFGGEGVPAQPPSLRHLWAGAFGLPGNCRILGWARHRFHQPESGLCR